MGAGNTKAREREEICPKINEYLVQKLLESTETSPPRGELSSAHPPLSILSEGHTETGLALGMGSGKEIRGTSAASNHWPVCCSLVTNRDPPLQKEAFQYLCSLQLFFLALKQKQNSLFTHCSSAPVLPTPLYLFVWRPCCVAPAPSKSPYNLQLNLAVYSEASAGEITQLGLILSAAEFCGSS